MIKRLSHCSLLGLVCFARLPWHVAFSRLWLCASVCECVYVLGRGANESDDGQLTPEAVKWCRGRGRGMPEGVLRVFMNTDISQSRKRVGAGLASLAVQQWRAVVRLHVLSVLSPALTSLAALQLPAGFWAQETRSAGGSFFSSASLELFSTKQSPKHRDRAAKIKIR